MNFAARIFVLIFILLAKSVLAFTGNDAGINVSASESIRKVEHTAFCSGDFLATDENDIRTSGEEDDQDQDIDLDWSFTTAQLLCGLLSFQSTPFDSHSHQGERLFLLFRNFRK